MSDLASKDSVDFLLGSCDFEDQAQVENVRRRLNKFTVVDLKAIAKRLQLGSCYRTRKKDVVDKLVNFGRSGQGKSTVVPEPVTPLCSVLHQLDNDALDVHLSLEDWLMRGEENSISVWPRLRCELEKLTVDSLKSLAKTLAARLTNTRGKADIVERLIVLSQVGALSRSSGDGTGTGLSYITPEVTEKLSMLPADLQSLDEGWTKSVATLKGFNFGQLFVYLVESIDKTFDHESMRAFKSLKGYTLFAAQCNCIAGLGAACSHVAAALFALENCFQQKSTTLPVESSVTGQPMRWNQPPKKQVDPSRVKDLTFEKRSHGKDAQSQKSSSCVRQEFETRHPDDLALDVDSFQTLLNAVQASFPESGIFKFWPKESTTSTLDQEGDVLDCLADIAQILRSSYRSLICHWKWFNV